MKNESRSSKLTEGYFCPICELRFSNGSIRNGLLPCGCNIKVEDAPYIEVHRNSKIRNKERDQIKLLYKSFKLESDGRSHPSFFKYVREKSMEIVQQDLLLKAVISARYNPTAYKSHWQARCSKCAFWLQRAKPPGLPLLKSSTKCSKVDFCLITCNAFKLDSDYALRPVWRRPYER